MRRRPAASSRQSVGFNRMRRRPVASSRQPSIQQPLSTAIVPNSHDRRSPPAPERKERKKIQRKIAAADRLPRLKNPLPAVRHDTRRMVCQSSIAAVFSGTASSGGKSKARQRQIKRENLSRQRKGKG